MIILKSKYDELDAKFQALVKENDILKTDVEKLKVDPSNSTKLAEMEASVKASVEAVEKLTAENVELKDKVEKLTAEQISVEVRAQQVTASQGVTPVAITEEDIKPSVSLLSQLAQIKNAGEQRKFWEEHREELRKEITKQK
jgi:deoxyribose-phosphate aldolase